MATIKQKLAFKEVVKGGTISGSMRKAGYSESASKRTDKLTRTLGWEELMKKHLPDSALAKKHRELLNKREYRTIEGESEDVGPETQAVSKALDMAYKLKGLYKNTEEASQKTLIVVVTGETAQRYAIPSIAEDSSS